MYRSSVPFRANDPLLQVPYTALHCLLCSATPPHVPLPPLPHRRLHAIPVTTSRCMSHHCMLLHPTACHTTTLRATLLHATTLHYTPYHCMLLYSTSLYFTGSYWNIHSTPLIFFIIFCCSLPSMQIDAHMGLVTSIHTHPSSSRAYKNLMLSSSLGHKILLSFLITFYNRSSSFSDYISSHPTISTYCINSTPPPHLL